MADLTVVVTDAPSVGLTVCMKVVNWVDEWAEQMVDHWVEAWVEMKVVW